MQRTKHFTVGKDELPLWLTEQASRGRIRLNRNDESELVSVTVYTPTKTYTAYLGDVIMYTKAGLSVIPQKAALKYGVENPTQANVKKEER